ncbi:MAG: hypothetical protein ACRCZP_09870 [Phycicoccus sp.]
MPERLAKLTHGLKPGDWIFFPSGECAEVTYTQRTPDRRETLVVLATGIAVTYDDDTAVYLASADDIERAKVDLARRAVADALEELARSFRDPRMPLPMYRTIAIAETVASVEDVHRAAEALGVEVDADLLPGRVATTWMSAPWGSLGDIRVVLTLSAPVPAPAAPAATDVPVIPGGPLALEWTRP